MIPTTYAKGMEHPPQPQTKCGEMEREVMEACDSDHDASRRRRRRPHSGKKVKKGTRHTHVCLRSVGSRREFDNRLFSPFPGNGLEGKLRMRNRMRDRDRK